MENQFRKKKEVDVKTLFNTAFFVKSVLEQKQLFPDGDNELFLILMKYIGIPNYQQHLETLYHFFKKYKNLIQEQEEVVVEEIWEQMLEESANICKCAVEKEEKDFLFDTLNFFLESWNR